MSDDVGIKVLQEKIDSWHATRAEIDALKEQIDELNKKLTPQTLDLIKIMEAMDLKNFQGTRGKVSLVTIDYVNNPKTEDDKKAFFDHLKQEGVFEDMVSVHHGKLNSYYKDKLDQAIELGQELSIPGLEAQQRQELRKGR